MPSSILAAGVTAAATAGANKLFGPKGNPLAPLQNFRPPGIDAGGLNVSSGGDIKVTPSAERLGLVSSVAGNFGDLAERLRMMGASVAPGVSELRRVRLEEIEGARQQAVGNLRENLQRRRVLGSSFGQDTIARAEAEFGQAKEKAAAESFLQELELSNQFLNQQFEAQRQSFQTHLDEMNLEANLAAGLAGKATETLGKNAQVLAALNAQEAAAAGKFFGQTFQPVFSAIGKSTGDFFKGGMPPFVPSGFTNGIPQGVGLGGFGGSFG